MTTLRSSLHLPHPTIAPPRCRAIPFRPLARFATIPYLAASSRSSEQGRCLVSVPVVAIVGRPNVGKSSLFNWLAGRRIAIVDPTAGVTRDRVGTLIPVGKRYVELTDTGGM